MKNTFLNDKTGHPIFRIIDDEPGSQYHDTSVNLTVYEIIAWSEKNEPVEEELYLTAYMKWDNCNHFYFGERDKDGVQDGYLHLCGAVSMQNHLLLMRFLYNYACELMGRKPEQELSII